MPCGGHVAAKIQTGAGPPFGRVTLRVQLGAGGDPTAPTASKYLHPFSVAGEKGL